MSFSGVEGFRLSKFRVFLVLCLGVAVGLTGLLPVAGGSAQAKYKQPGCAKFKKKKQAKGKAKKQRLQRKFKQCQANRKVYNQVKDSRFVGTRESGFTVDIILCANGKFADDYGSDFEQIYNKGWRITDARIKGKNFTAAYEALISKSKVGNTNQIQVGTRAGAIVRRNGKWQSGSESFGRPDDIGDMTRTSAKKECRKL